MLVRPVPELPRIGFAGYGTPESSDQLLKLPLAGWLLWAHKLVYQTVSICLRSRA